jgi:hypothetical protein
MGVGSMRKGSGCKQSAGTRIVAALMIVVGVAIVLICVPYWFWAAVIGIVLTILGILLWNA